MKCSELQKRLTEGKIEIEENQNDLLMESDEQTEFLNIIRKKPIPEFVIQAKYEI